MQVGESVAAFQLVGNADIAPQMAAYMKNQFPFVGVQSVARRQQSRPLVQASRQVPVATVLDWIAALAHRREREYTYVAYDLASATVRRFTLADLQTLLPLLLHEPWWDSVDGWRKVYGDYLARQPEALPTVYGWFYAQPSLWQRRVAITLQLMAKARTDQGLLLQAILYDRTNPEFFLQKAIGWALRQYSKTNADWVRDCLNTYAFNALARREASKFL